MAEVEEPPAKRARTGDTASDDELNQFSLEDLFGDDATHSSLDKVLAEHMADQSDVESHYSNVESHQEFVVDDPDRPPADETAYGLNPVKLSLVTDIFGDLSVLKPLGDIDGGDEQPVDASVHASLGAAEAAVAESLAKHQAASDIKDESQSQALPALPLEDALDPDVLEKSYQLPKDQAIARSQQPERWLQAYGSDGQNLPRKSDEEYQNEARWMYNQVFKARSYDRPSTENAIIRVLSTLHESKFELIYIVEHVYWKIGKSLTKEDVWKIQEYDLLWQPIWTRYMLLVEWVMELERHRVSVPEHIKEKVNRKVWQQADSEESQRDAHDWLRSMHPTFAPRAESLQSTVSSVDAVMKMTRRSKFDEKLGIAESLDALSLQPFGITPAELGANVAHGKQLFGPREEQESCKDVCIKHIDQNFPTWEAVRDGVSTFLMRLIAAEPRVRGYVRKEFWKHCAISAKVTEAGRSLAKDAAHNFKKSYRGFTVAYRPVSRFHEHDDLFLEMMQLQSKGFIKIHYDLVVEDPKEERQKVVMPCQSWPDFIRIKQKLTSHAEKRHLPEDHLPTDPSALENWNKCEEIMLKLEGAACLKEADSRRNAARDLKGKVKASYESASMNLPIDILRLFLMQDPILEHLSEMYCQTSDETAKRHVIESDWNKVRRAILRRALAEELYPMFWAEVQDYLIKMSSQVVCEATRVKLTQMLDVKPAMETDLTLNEAEDKLKQMRAEDDDVDLSRRREDPDWISERGARKKGLCSALVILPEVTKETASVAFVNAFGEAVDIRSFFTSCLHPPRPVQAEKGSFRADVELKVQQHREELKTMLSLYKPAVVLLAVTAPDILKLKDNLEQILTRSQDVLVHFKVLPKIYLVDTTLPRAVAYNKRVSESPAYRDYKDHSQRIAISCARFYQDALAEASQLWHEIHDENGLLKVALHPLQKEVPKEMMSRAITRTLQEVLAKTGLQINKVRRAAHMSSLIQFLPGLGPRKAKLFMKTLANSVKSRQSVADIMAKQLNMSEEDQDSNPVIKNMLPFIKIDPDFRDSWSEEDLPSLDRLRIPPSLQRWVLTFCTEALEGQANDLFGESADEAMRDVQGDDVVARVIRLLREDPSFLNVIQDRDWSNWPTNAGEPNYPDCADIDKLFNRITDELVEPYKDLRQSSSEIPENELFYLALAESSHQFRTGCVVRGIVKFDEEYPEKDPGKEGNANPKVIVSMAGSGRAVRASFKKAYAQGKSGFGTDGKRKAGHIAGCNRQFRAGEAILARLISVATGRNGFNVMLSVDQDEDKWFEEFPISEEDLPYFLPGSSDDWTKVSLGLLDNSELKQKADLKDWVRRPRNIKHPHFTVGDHTHVVQVIHRQTIGFCLFRSSKHYDCLYAMLKVKPTMASESPIGSGLGEQVDPEKCYRQFDVFEHRSTKDHNYGEGFEVANKLEVEGKMYRDFDEVIARHMDPIIANLKQIAAHKHYGLKTCYGRVTDANQVKKILREFSEDNNMLNYKLLLHEKQVGHGALLWTVQGRRVKAELLEVYADGFRLLGSHFSSLQKALAWFKSTGWRNAVKLRQDVKQEWRVKNEEIVEKRGRHADPDAGERRKKTIRMALGETGLNTPAGLASVVPTAGVGTPDHDFTREANARTPYRLMSNPGSTRTVPETPAMAGTPARGAQPVTPAAAFERSGPPTPRHSPARSAYQPTTPNLLGNLTPGAIVPETPHPGTPGTPARRTPSGIVPQTPMAAFPAPWTPGTPRATPGTPAAAFPGGAPGTPGTPRTPVPQTPVPQTPHAGHYVELKEEYPGTPNIVPQTPAH